MAEHWTELIVGVWVLITPWLLGFSNIAIMKWSNVLCGLVLILMNARAIFGESGKVAAK